MKASFHVVVTEIDSEKWAANNNGVWPEHDKRSLNTAVRQDILEEIRYRLQNIAVFDELGIKVEVK